MRIRRARVEDAGVGDVEGGHLEILKHEFRHAFSVCWRVPCGLCYEDGVLCGFTSQFVQRARYELRYGGEVVYFGERLSGNASGKKATYLVHLLAGS